jgi:hypothetical protein
MSTPFGPQLIGETEKALNALLRRFLEGTGLTEPEWVTLRIADARKGTVGPEHLAAAVTERAHYLDAVDLVDALTDRDLLHDGQLSPVGRELVTILQARIRTETAPIWDELPADDVAAAARVLNEVVDRARFALSGLATSPGQDSKSGRLPRRRSERPAGSSQSSWRPRAVRSRK